MINHTTKCFVLHSRPYRETSLLIDFFSLSVGRFSVVAKGIKQKKSQNQRAVLQPFSLINIEYTGRSELKVLCHAELTEQPSRLPTRAIACGYYINELLMRSLQSWQEIPSLFESYSLALSKLKSDVDLASTLRNFEVSLLSELGVAPDWQYDIHGNLIEAKSYYFFNSEHGFEKSERTRFTERELNSYSGLAILDLNRGIYHLESAKESQSITQMLLRQIIGQRPLESRKLWV